MSFKDCSMEVNVKNTITKKRLLIGLSSISIIVLVFVYESFDNAGSQKQVKDNVISRQVAQDNKSITHEFLSDEFEEEAKERIEKAHNKSFHKSVQETVNLESHSNDEDNRDWWFDSPILESRERFSKAETVIDLDVSCKSGSSINDALSLEQNFERSTNIDLQARFQEDLFYFSLTQFWQLDDHYFQFVAIWDRDMPARYRYEFYQSKDKTFGSMVDAIDLPIAIPEVKDVITTNEYIELLIDHYQEKGANIGSRILESSINEQDGEQAVTIVNSKLIQWHTSQFSCDSRVDTANAFCHCERGESV